MKIPYELKLAWRYSRQPKKLRSAGGFVSFISATSVASIALGVMALIIVLSVMNGFQKEVRDRMLSVVSHVDVASFDGGIKNPEEVEKVIKSERHVVSCAPYISGQALLSTNERMRGVLLRGIEPAKEASVDEIASQIRYGTLNSLNEDGFNIVLGTDLARALRVGIGSKVNVMIPQGRLTPAGIIPRIKTFTVTGLFSSGHYEYDASMALIGIEDAKVFFKQEAPMGFRVRLDNMDAAPAVAMELSKKLPQNTYASDWSQQNKTWFAAVQVEKRMMAVILFLIVLVGAFGLVSSMVMTVSQKQSDIAILRTLGARPASIMAVFVVQGAIIGAVGVGIGVILGLAVSYNVSEIVSFIESLFHVEFLPRQIYFISTMPSDPRASDIVPIALISFALSILATLYPSLKAASVHPAEALRYE